MTRLAPIIAMLGITMGCKELMIWNNSQFKVQNTYFQYSLVIKDKSLDSCKLNPTIKYFTCP